MSQSRLEIQAFPRAETKGSLSDKEVREAGSCEYLALLRLCSPELGAVAQEEQLVNGNVSRLWYGVSKLGAGQQQEGRAEPERSMHRLAPAQKKTALGTTSINFIFLEASGSRREREGEGKKGKGEGRRTEV